MPSAYGVVGRGGPRIGIDISPGTDHGYGYGYGYGCGSRGYWPGGGGGSYAGSSNGTGHRGGLGSGYYPGGTGGTSYGGYGFGTGCGNGMYRQGRESGYGIGYDSGLGPGSSGLRGGGLRGRIDPVNGVLNGRHIGHAEVLRYGSDYEARRGCGSGHAGRLHGSGRCQDLGVGLGNRRRYGLSSSRVRMPASYSRSRYCSALDDEFDDGGDCYHYPLQLTSPFTRYRSNDMALIHTPSAFLRGMRRQPPLYTGGPRLLGASVWEDGDDDVWEDIWDEDDDLDLLACTELNHGYENERVGRYS